MISVNVIRNSWAAIWKDGGNPGRNFKEATKLATVIFNNTCSFSLPFILIGPDRIREDEALKCNFHLITQKNTGAILGEQQWSTLINDVFILGAIHSKKEVLLVMPDRPSKAQIWDEKKGRFTSLGRELAILFLGGYRKVQNQYQIVFKNDEEQTLPSLEGIWSELKKIKLEQIEGFLRS